MIYNNSGKEFNSNNNHLTNKNINYPLIPFIKVEKKQKQKLIKISNNFWFKHLNKFKNWKNYSKKLGQTLLSKSNKSEYSMKRKYKN